MLLPIHLEVREKNVQVERPDFLIEVKNRPGVRKGGDRFKRTAFPSRQQVSSYEIGHFTRECNTPCKRRQQGCNLNEWKVRGDNRVKKRKGQTQRN